MFQKHERSRVAQISLAETKKKPTHQTGFLSDTSVLRFLRKMALPVLKLLSCAAVLLAIPAAFGASAIGRVEWEISVGGGVESAPHLVNVSGVPTIVFSSFDGFMYGIEADKPHHQMFRRVAGNDMVRSAVGTYNKGATTWLFFVGGDSRLYCVDAVTGKVRWTFASGPSGVYASSSPLVFDDGQTVRVYFGSVDNLVYALNATSGTVLWSFPTNAPIYASPTLFNAGDTATVYIGSDDACFYALDARTGKPVWKYTTMDKIRGGASVWANGTAVSIFVGSNDGIFYAFDALTGAVRFQFPTGGPAYATPFVHTFANGSTVLFTGSYDKNIYAVDAISGEQKWAFKTGDFVIASPRAVVIGTQTVVVVGSNDYIFYAIDGSTGAELWKYYTEQEIWSSALILPGPTPLAVFGVQDGSLYCMKLAP
jgi:eukaryotic-like serine/threonine-protein kinase